MCRPAADEAPRPTREKISGTQGRETEESYHKQQLERARPGKCSAE